MPAHLITLFVIGLIALISPGPDFFLMLRNSIRSPKTAFDTATGTTLGCFLQITACVLGISVLLKETPALYHAIRLLGAAYLIYLGVKSLIGFFTRVEPAVAEVDGLKGSTNGFRDGLLCNLLNPKCTLFFLSVFSQFTDATTSIEERILYGATLWLQAIVYWYSLVFLLQRRRVSEWVGRFGRIADPILGVILTTLGLGLIVA